MSKIANVFSREILDSRGYPTVETTVVLSTGHHGTASVPSSAASGKYEAVEIRDHDLGRFNGYGVLTAVANVNQKIAPAVKNLDVTSQTKLDQRLIDLDGTANKALLGGNAILSVSLAGLKAAASFFNLPLYRYIFQKYRLTPKLAKLPSPTFNIINGGAHGAGNLDFQEFHIIPSVRFPYHTALQIGEEIYQALKHTLKNRDAIHSVGDEGGFAPNLFTNMDALEVMMEAIDSTAYKFAQDVFLGLDVAATFFYQNGHYQIKDRAQPFSGGELIDYYSQLNRQYRLFSLEDALAPDDWDGWAKLTNDLAEDTLIVGDDLLSTNAHRVKKAIETHACNAILVKPNQAGTVSETISVIKLAKTAGWKIIASHRSGETNDTFIADFAVGIGADYTKFGAPARGERVAKYNRLLAIESEINLIK
ncbi:MAG: Enolase [Candidatus Beckwithbacteria bacterium GW2011_GWB1_47_15]|uniref:Enolase n=1 Tax=Candidatus Beckwithbacteria bacterium GW2011_GWB1_47_15 TaxID=1618371 RepID=A0A0G1RTY8_9BACT|nr:MAG: enolase, enolase [Candidatus Beckwithbacteria bacterium GW2011_GWC1_49_16]KKU35130.1 MAG: Enolase [Candidatus Beckwithbacteria bacterium GW2011_GWA1_46_30]KKU60774.1 MAG: Enolase [Candidatus Beckwithbacteria bacterium GW2011_GWB1_47_15]KKU71579.1 MAG: Enolase [Candidatus Beckwithbacteria bacterium GW2011_GWA2_47_25]KKW03468.1 MAG: Enolase [Candidatus Beckwithbacteria bacterium GW2011_GWC2_49_11]OGD49158.1 MAG: phosphopyruvate hydratase [Candidatus Beckwithbacteria bacterium RIFCSPHIGHO